MLLSGRVTIAEKLWCGIPWRIRLARLAKTLIHHLGQSFGYDVISMLTTNLVLSSFAFTPIRMHALTAPYVSSIWCRPSASNIVYIRRRIEILNVGQGTGNFC